MTLGQILGAIAIVLGFVAGVIDKGEVLGMAAVAWFVLAIALVCVFSIGAVAVPFVSRKET